VFLHALYELLTNEFCTTGRAGALIIAKIQTLGGLRPYAGYEKKVFKIMKNKSTFSKSWHNRDRQL